MSQNPQLIDCNAHLDFLTDSLFEVALKSSDREIGEFLVPGVSPLGFSRQSELVGQFPKSIKIGLGLHPWFVCQQIEQGSSTHSLMDSFLQVLTNFKKDIDLIGEVGLDYSSPEKKALQSEQTEIFIEVLTKSQSMDKPLLLHIVSAHGQAIEILRDFKGLKFIVHGFSGSFEVAKQYLSIGGVFSVGPGVFKDNFKKLLDCLRQPEFQRSILFETDCPEAFGSKQGYDHGLLNRVIEKTSIRTGLSKKTLVDSAQAHFLELFK